MELPDLPRKNKRMEAKLDGRVADWFMKHHHFPVLLEVKMKGGKVSEHQEKLIKKVSRTGKFKHKFRDGGLRTALDYIVVPKELDAALCVCDENGKCTCTINNNKDYKIDIKV